MLLDHISLLVPDVAVTAALLRDRLGLITTRTPAAPDRHGRVYLDRGYLEVASGAAVPSPAYFFLRYERLDATVEALRRRGLAARASATPYEGHDGTWQDIEVDAGPAAPLPLLTRRTKPPEVAADWPPPLAVPHPCGARSLAAVHLRVPRLWPVLTTYARLLGSPATRLGAGRAAFDVGAARIVLHEAAVRPAAIVAVELRVSSLRTTRAHLSALGTEARCEGDALWAGLPGGWGLGFRETG